MKRQNKYRTPSEIARIEKQRAELMTAYKLIRILAVSVLYDRFDFTDQQARDFLDDLNTLLDSIDSGQDDLKTMIDNIEQYVGVRIDI